MANSVASVAITVVAVAIAFKMAFYTLKKVVFNALMGSSMSNWIPAFGYGG